MTMFSRFLLLVLFLCGMSFGSRNWNGWLDTAEIVDFNGTDLLYSKAFDLSSYENTRVLLKVDDTASAGFASDSVNFGFGYQVGMETVDTGGTRDTAWGPIVWKDTLHDSTMGTVPVGWEDSTGIITLAGRYFDTLSVAGYATYQNSIVPPWSPLIRYAFQGIAGNSAVTPIKLIVQNGRRIGITIGP